MTVIDDRTRGTAIAGCRTAAGRIREHSVRHLQQQAALTINICKKDRRTLWEYYQHWNLQKYFSFLRKSVPFLTVPEMWSRSAIIWWILRKKED